MPNPGKQLVVLAGLPLTSKTTVGRKLAKDTGTTFLDIDETRHKVNPSKEWLGPEKEKEIMMAAYALNHKLAGELLSVGKAVILAATYSRPAYHDMLRHLTAQYHADLKVFLFQIPESEAEARLKTRQDSPSNIVSMESYHEVADRYQAFEGAIPVDATQPVEAVTAAIKNYLV